MVVGGDEERWERQGCEPVRHGVDGSKAGKFSEAQLQSGLGRMPDADGAGLKEPDNRKMERKDSPQNLGEKLDEIINILEPLKSALSGS